jgi:hypothetical protein
MLGVRGGGVVAIFRSVVQTDLIKNVAFEQRLENDEKFY